MAYDSQRDRTVLFGGFDINGVRLGDTWEWDGSNWTEVATTGPSARALQSMAYDSHRGKTVLFGGDFNFGDTWEWDGSSWIQVATTGPSPSSSANGSAMAFDSRRGMTVLFRPLSHLLPGDTWEWDGSTWTYRHASGPIGISGPAMAYDSQRERIVLFGGASYLNGHMHTWEWDGTNWTPVASGPLRHRTYSGVAYDSSRGQTVLFGGYKSGVSPFYGDTWKWNGISWTEWRFASPSARSRHAMTYDSQRGLIVLFGGSFFTSSNGYSVDPGSYRVFGDTWVFNPGPPASYETFGTGCAGSAGTPTLAPVAEATPWLGETFELEIGSIPSAIANVPFGLLGLSGSSWEGIELPRELSKVGMSGCIQYTSIDFVFTLVNEGGSATWQIPIPSNPALIGLSFYTQALAFDFGTNFLGAVVSNAGEGVIGAR